MTKTIFFTTKDHLDMAKAEIETTCKCVVKEIKEGIFIGEPKLIVPVNRFGLVKEIFTLNKILSKEKSFGELLDDDIKNSYKINIISDDATIKTKDVANKIYERLSSPIVNLENPEHEYMLLFLDEDIYLLESKEKNTDHPDERKSHKKTHNHPTSLNPRMAKAIINLCGKNSFHDPFCGTGGLVIEGALQGLIVSGSDIAPGLLIKAKENAKKYSIKLNLFHKDALKLETKYPAIVTDLPYGRNSTLSQEINKLYKEFFASSQKITNHMVVGMMESTETQNLLKDTSWKIKYTFIIYVHKSLSRKILVLEK